MTTTGTRAAADDDPFEAFPGPSPSPGRADAAEPASIQTEVQLSTLDTAKTSVTNKTQATIGFSRFQDEDAPPAESKQRSVAFTRVQTSAIGVTALLVGLVTGMAIGSKWSGEPRAGRFDMSEVCAASGACH